MSVIVTGGCTGHTVRTLSEYNAWVTIDLGRPAAVAGVRVHNGYTDAQGLPTQCTCDIAPFTISLLDSANEVLQEHTVSAVCRVAVAGIRLELGHGGCDHILDMNVFNWEGFEQQHVRYVRVMLANHSAAIHISEVEVCKSCLLSFTSLLRRLDPLTVWCHLYTTFVHKVAFI